MKTNKLYYLLLLCLLTSFSAHATTHVIDIPNQGNIYSPSNLTVMVGDTVMFTGSANHPTTHVTEDTWNSNGTTAISGALFDSSPAPFTFVTTEEGTIYYVCDFHVQGGMKGTINVEAGATAVEVLNSDVSIAFSDLPVRDGILKYTISSSSSSVNTISMINIAGQEVLSREIESNIGRLELNIPAGLYIVLLKDRKDNVLYKETIGVE